MPLAPAGAETAFGRVPGGRVPLSYPPRTIRVDVFCERPDLDQLLRKGHASVVFRAQFHVGGS